MNNNDFKIDLKEFIKQHHEELSNMPHALKIEIIVPPLDLNDIEKEATIPSVQVDSNGGFNSMTMGMALYTIEQFKKQQLEQSDFKACYDFVKVICNGTECLEARFEKGEENDKS